MTIGEFEPLIPAHFLEIAAIGMGIGGGLLTNEMWKNMRRETEKDGPFHDIAHQPSIKIIPFVAGFVLWGVIPQIPLLGSLYGIFGIIFSIMFLYNILGSARVDFAEI